MSRDQKPGKFKLVGSAAPNYGRRAGDKPLGGKTADETGAAQDIRGAADPATNAASSRPRRLLPALLFLAGCAAGGSSAVVFGFVEGLSQ